METISKVKKELRVAEQGLERDQNTQHTQGH